MAFGAFVIVLLFCRMLVPYRFVYGVLEDGCLGMHGVLILLKYDRVAFLTGSVLQLGCLAKECQQQEGEKYFLEFHE